MRRGRSEKTERPLPSGHWPGERASVVLPQYRVSSRYDGSRPQLMLATVSIVYGIQDNHTQTCHLVRIVRIQYGCWPFLR